MPFHVVVLSALLSSRNTRACPPVPPRRVHIFPTTLIHCAILLALLFSDRSSVIVASQTSSAASPRAQWFSSPLIPTRTPDDAENLALNQAMARFEVRSQRDDFTDVLSFLDQFPDGAWAAAIETELAKEWHRTGWYSRSLAIAEKAWARRQTSTHQGTALWNHTGLRLAELYVSFGRPAELEKLLKEFDPERLSSGDRQRFRSAEHGLQLMQRRPEFAYRCGALALDRLLAKSDPSQVGHARIQSARASAQGLSLSQVSGLASELGLHLQMAHRSPGAPLIFPAVVHWRIGHFSAALERRGALILTQSPTLWSDVWISDSAWDAESTGYCLVPEGPLPAGWRSVTPEEASRVFGRNGITLDASDPNSTTPWDDQSCREPQGPSAWPGTPGSPGMATAHIHLMLLSQQVVDTPIGYTPPAGPPVYTTFQFTEKGYEHYGYRPQWTHNWQGSLYEDPRNPFESIWVAVEGGWVNFIPDDASGTSFRGKTRNLGRLQRTSDTNITWSFPDGTKKLYATPFGTNVATTRTFWLTGHEDASGNRLRIQVTPWGRVDGVTDSIGRKTQFFYELADPGLPQKPQSIPVTSNFDYSNQVTRIVDPFGRTAQFSYTKVERTIDGFCDGFRCAFYFFNYDLTAITDVGGLQSQFTYDPLGSAITALTTPYGTTRFQWGNNTRFGYRNFWVDVTDPEGGTERFEYHDDAPIPSSERLGSLPQGMLVNNAALNERNVFHWDKQAYATAMSSQGYSNAVIYHYQYSENLEATGPILESIKRPLESRIWMNYPGQGQPWAPGNDDQASRTGRVLDDGSTQLFETLRDDWGNITRAVDPVGRVTEYVYSTNRVDLLEIRENRTGTPQRLLTMTYDSRHRVTQTVDLTGKTNQFTYNLRGQLLTQSNPKGEITTYTYDASGNLLSADGPLPGNQDRSSFTYDTFGRVRTVTDSDGFQVTYNYDAFDRWTNKAYADSTFETVTYDKLDAVKYRDREGREYRNTYDALQRMVKTEDPLGRTRQFEWCRCGSLVAMVDPLGRTTRWTYDVQGRVSTREYPDGSKVSYEYENTTSRLKHIRDEQGQIMELGYAQDDQIQEKRFLNAIRPTPPVRFEYDSQFDRIVRIHDTNGTTAYQYLPITGGSRFGAGALASVDGPLAGDTLTWDYDRLGRIQRQTLGNATTSYQFDTSGRLLELSNTLGKFSITWEAGSYRMSNLQFPNGQKVAYLWLGGTNEARPLQTTWSAPGGSILAEWGYQYRNSGFLSRWSRVQPGSSTVWIPEYDLAGRLTQISESGSAGNRSYRYSYDASDNRTSETVPGLARSWQYNILNQSVGYQGPAMPALSFEWDAEDRLYAIVNGTRRTEFTYDGLGRRSRMRVLGPSGLERDHRYVWIGDELAEERNATGENVMKRFFAWGFEVVQSEVWPAGRYFYIRDHLHSIRAVIDANGAVVCSFDYDPFGRRQQLTGTLIPDMGFGGHWQSDAHGLLLSLYRSYDPEQGRWLSRDPIHEKDHFNLYAYAGNNPVNWGDRFGLAADLTIAGVDTELQTLGDSISPPAGEIVVVIHGNPDGSFEIIEKGKKGTKPKYRKIDAGKLAVMIRNLPRFKEATRIRLMSCRTANGKFPGDLARYTGKEVLAPTTTVRGDPDTGKVKLVDKQTGKESGEWKPFAPSGRGPDIPLSGKANVDITLD